MIDLSSYERKFKNFFHLLSAFLANVFYRFSAKKIKVIGVTGTDGKTTTVHLIYEILKRAGKKASMISSVYALIADKEYDTGFHVTTPNSWFLQKIVRRVMKRGGEYLILEVTSHGLDQNRVWGIPFEIGVLTNITSEHLNSYDNYDYFLTWNNYLKTKAKLFRNSKLSIINKDDKSYKKIKDILVSHNKNFVSYGLYQQADIKLNLKKILNKKLAEFNQYNYLAAYAVCKNLCIKEKDVIAGLKNFKLPPGRLETVYNKDFKIIIDFAHTINSVKQVLKFLRKKVLKSKRGRIIHVFGAAGLRDRTKRSKMGKASCQYADIIILTEEDYRSENVNKIIKEIEKGINSKTKLFKISNRQEAINKAVSLAKKGDIVLLTGKGHEKSLCRGEKEHAWSEHKAVKQALRALNLK